MNVHYGNVTEISNVFIDSKLPNMSLKAVVLYIVTQRHPDLIRGFHEGKPKFNMIQQMSGLCRVSVQKAWDEIQPLYLVHPIATESEKCGVCEDQCQPGIKKLAQKPLPAKAAKKTRRARRAS